MINREKFDAELAAAGVVALGYNADGPQEGRAVLAGGTLVGHDGAVSHTTGGVPDAAAAAAYRAALLAHVPAETLVQRARRREQLRDVALAAVLKQLQGGPAAPAWCQGMVDNMAARVGEGA